MPTTPAPRDRLAAGPSRLPRAGRRLGVRDGWAASAPAGWDEVDAVRLTGLVERLLDDLEVAGEVAAGDPGRLATSRVAS